MSYDGPFIFPLRKEHFKRYSSPYGPRNGSFHNGVDLACSAGAPVFAPKDGVVDFAQPYAKRGGRSGIYIGIKMKDGYTVSFSHMSGLLLRKGDPVVAGQMVGWAGSTGDSTGPHIHLRLRLPLTEHMDPVPYLKDAVMYD